MVRLRRDAGVVGVCLVAGVLATPTIARTTCFADPAAFQQAMLDVGKLPKFGRWGFKPDAPSITAYVVPSPSSMALLGFAGLAARRRRRCV